MPDPIIPSDRIAAGARQLGLDLDSSVCDRLAAYGALLLRWNRRINLIARGAGVDEVVERHLLDAVALLRLVRPAGRVVDVGAGAGLPGLPLWIAAPGASLTCVEPTAKRVAFLRTAARELGLPGVSLQAERFEALSDDARFDLLLSRATFAPEEWVAVAAPRRAPHGRVVVMLSRADTEAVTEAAAAHGLRVVAEDAYTLPWSGATRRNLLLG